MKLLRLLFILLILGGCHQYKDVEPITQLNGTKIVIDSTQWRTVLIQEVDQSILIAEKGEIKRIRLIDEGVFLVLFTCCVVCVILFFAALTK